MIKNEEYMEYLRIIDGRQRRRAKNKKSLSRVVYPTEDAWYRIEAKREGGVKMEKWLKPEQVMEILQISKSTLKRIVDAGKIPKYKIGHLVRFSESDINEFIMKGRVS